MRIMGTGPPGPPGCRSEAPRPFVVVPSKRARGRIAHTPRIALVPCPFWSGPQSGDSHSPLAALGPTSPMGAKARCLAGRCSCKRPLWRPFFLARRAVALYSSCSVRAVCCTCRLLCSLQSTLASSRHGVLGKVLDGCVFTLFPSSSAVDNVDGYRELIVVCRT